MNCAQPSAEEAVGDLSPYLAWLHRRLAEGHRFSIPWFASAGRYSPGLHAHLIRSVLLARLGTGCPLGLTYSELPNDGVQVARDRYQIRILKARSLEPEPRLYPAGRNGARSNYFEQVPLFDFPVSVVNLVLSWSADESGLHGVGLALPIGTGRWPDDAEVAWHVPLTLVSPMERDVDDEEDLEFRPLLEGEEGDTGTSEGSPW